MRFFGTNQLFEDFGGTITASSGTPSFAFDEDDDYPWTSSGEGTDGNAVYIQQVLAASVSIDSIFIKDSNIDDLAVEVDVGSGFVALTNYTQITSADGTSHLFVLNSSISLAGIKITGSNTITANEEKEIGQILAFLQIGQIKYVSDINPRKQRIQKRSKLSTGKEDIINKGTYFEFQIKFKAHYSAADNSVIQDLRDQEDAFWIWINDNEEENIVMSQEPFRFGDIYKVGNIGVDNLSFAKNFFRSGVDFDLNLVEVP